jgi:hypothetical protein
VPGQRNSLPINGTLGNRFKKPWLPQHDANKTDMLGKEQSALSYFGGMVASHNTAVLHKSFFGNSLLCFPLGRFGFTQRLFPLMIAA